VGRVAPSAGAADGDVFVQRVGADGSAGWWFSYGTEENEEARAVVEIPGGYVMAGYVEAYGNGGGDMLCQRVTDAGGIGWTHYFQNEEQEQGWDIVFVNDHEYAVVGTKEWTSDDGVDMYLVRTFADGSFGWGQTYGGEGSQYAEALDVTSDGGFILAGYDFSGPVPQLMLVKTSGAGAVEWSVVAAGENESLARDVIGTADGGCVFVGRAALDDGPTQMLLAKVFAGGAPEWSQIFTAGDYAEGWALEQTSDGGFILAGATGTLDQDMYLVKTDADGNEEWSRTFGGSALDWAYDVRQTPDGGYVIAGYTESFGVGRDAYLVKTDANGNAPSVPAS